jgi:hypothetical protein
MIRPAKLSLDLEDNIIDSGILDTAPFPMTYTQTNHLLPNFASIMELAKQTLVTFPQPDVSMETIKTCITQAFPTSM